jgi:hypothetical protein
MADDYNPIKSVDNYAVPSPSSFQWEMEDLSDSSAGRTEDGKMHKNRIGSKVAISLSWQNVSTAVASQVLKRFNAEYFKVNYLDPEEGEYIEKTFYVGNRTAPMYNSQLGLWSNVSFKIIEQ